MKPSTVPPNYVRDLNIAAVAAWRSSSHGIIDLNAYDLLVEELIVAERLIEVPTNPAYWSMQDVHAMQVYLTRIQARAEAYHMAMQQKTVSVTDPDLPL